LYENFKIQLEKRDTSSFVKEKLSPESVSDASMYVSVPSTFLHYLFFLHYLNSFVSCNGRNAEVIGQIFGTSRKSLKKKHESTALKCM
jgi:hypothetical protein